MQQVYPLDLVQEQIQRLRDKLKSTASVQEKNILFKRLVNLVGVMEFLIAMNKN